MLKSSIINLLICNHLLECVKRQPYSKNKNYNFKHQLWYFPKANDWSWMFKLQIYLLKRITFHLPFSMLPFPSFLRSYHLRPLTTIKKYNFKLKKHQKIYFELFKMKMNYFTCREFNLHESYNFHFSFYFEIFKQ